MHDFYACGDTRRISAKTPGTRIYVRGRHSAETANLVNGPMGMCNDVEEQLRWKQVVESLQTTRTSRLTGEHNNVDVT